MSTVKEQDEQRSGGRLSGPQMTHTTTSSSQAAPLKASTTPTSWGPNAQLFYFGVCEVGLVTTSTIVMPNLYERLLGAQCLASCVFSSSILVLWTERWAGRSGLRGLDPGSFKAIIVILGWEIDQSLGKIPISVDLGCHREIRVSKHPVLWSEGKTQPSSAIYQVLLCALQNGTFHFKIKAISTLS